ncbi:hypothetical protein [Salinisphaera sp. PC39]|uniref:hypothetical protein n=1 Tax=Salinisphaera sp. PC39 TaxID=1304156 RepID=UPI0033409A1F
MVERFAVRTVAAGVALLLAACATGPRVAHETGQTRFQYPDGETASDTGVAFSMVAPRLWSATDDSAPESDTPFADMTRQFRAQARFQVEDADPATNPFQRRLLETYRPRIEAALDRDIAELLRSKGFRADTSSPRFEDLDPDARAKTLLTTVPTATLAVSREVDERECGGGYCRESGRLRLDGQFLLLVVESGSGSPVAIRRMNLHSLGIDEPYVRYTDDADSDGGAPPGGEEPLRDTTDRALVAVLNRFYAAAMAEVDRLVSRRQVLAFHDSLRSLESEPAP